MRSAILSALALTACEGDDGGDGGDGHTHPAEPEAFALRFVPRAGDAPCDCSTPASGFGPAADQSVGLSDLRFYVSNLRFLDAAGAEIDATFDENEFQYTGDAGWVALVDLTSNATGSCEATAISFSEGTERMHEAITGTTLVDDVAAVAFDVGVPQALMQEVIAENTIEGAPSPLDEMYWSWNSGYRHFVVNFTVTGGEDDGEGYVHVGSTGCTNADGELALETRDTCAYVNTPSVHLPDFDLATGHVIVDLAEILSELDFVSPVYDPETFEIIGEQVGVECHSSAMQDDCPTIFDHFGVDIDTGAADAAVNSVFRAG
jgi:uncharacterized repeat protein (TIGR04052 family)